MLLALSMATLTLYALRPCDLAWHLHRQHGLEQLQRCALRLPAHGLRQPDVALEEVRPHLDSRIMGGALRVRSSHSVLVYMENPCRDNKRNGSAE